MARYRVSGTGNGKRFADALVEAESVEVVMAKAAARGIQIESVALVEVPPKKAPPPIPQERDRATPLRSVAVSAAAVFGAVAVALLTLWKAGVLSPAQPQEPADTQITEKDRQAAREMALVRQPEPAPPEEPQKPEPVPRRKPRLPGDVALLEGQAGPKIPFVRSLYLDQFLKFSDADDQLGLAGMMVEKRWWALDNGIRVRIIESHPFKGWAEVRVESGDHVGQLGMVPIHTLGNPAEVQERLNAESLERTKIEARQAATDRAEREKREEEQQKQAEKEAKLKAESDARLAVQSAEKKAAGYVRQAEAMLRAGQKGSAKDYASKALEVAPEGSEPRKRAEEILGAKP